MKVELTIRQDAMLPIRTKVTIDGCEVMVEHLLKAIREEVKKTDTWGGNEIR